MAIYIPRVTHLKTDMTVIPKYEALIQSSFGAEGSFIRAKENIVAMFKDYSINSADKAGIISNILGALTTSIANTSMSVALQWATEERKLAFDKEELALKIYMADKDDALKDAQLQKLRFEAHAIQADSIRTMGTRVIMPDGWEIEQILGDNGKAWSDLETDKVKLVNLGKEGAIMDEKIVESHAAVHKLIAETYVNYGKFRYDLDSGGAHDITPSKWESSLSYMQMQIAKEQAKGYTYNAWANAVTASAGMVGTIVASDGAIDADIETILGIFRTTVENLHKIKLTGILDPGLNP